MWVAGLTSVVMGVGHHEDVDGALAGRHLLCGHLHGWVLVLGKKGRKIKNEWSGTKGFFSNRSPSLYIYLLFRFVLLLFIVTLST